GVGIHRHLARQDGLIPGANIGLLRRLPLGFEDFDRRDLISTPDQPALDGSEWALAHETGGRRSDHRRRRLREEREDQRDCQSEASEESCRPLSVVRGPWSVVVPLPVHTAYLLFFSLDPCCRG